MSKLKITKERQIKVAVRASRPTICYTSAFPFTFGSLFSGIGGMDLGLERAGWRCEWQVEIKDYARKVLDKHWRDVPKFRDVREVGRHNLKPVSLIAGGFPCQDVSEAKQNAAGLDGERSGLWFEFFRIVSELRPDFVIVENVAALLGRGIGRILGQLSEIGYDAEWEIIPACAIGAPHSRERLFLISYPANSQRLVLPRTRGNLVEASGKTETEKYVGIGDGDWWAREPGLVRVADGIPNWIHRNVGLGNAVVPQIAEMIGNAIRRTIEDV